MPRSTNALAIASLVCSIIGLFLGVLAILGLIFGCVARVQVRRTGDNGAGMAVAGIIISVIAIVGWTAVVVFLYRLAHECGTDAYGYYTCPSNVP